METKEFIESTRVELIRLAEPANKFAPRTESAKRLCGYEETKETQYYKLRLQFNGRIHDFDYSQGWGHEKHPTIEAVLECLQSDCNTETGSINDFMAEYGYTDAEETQGIMIVFNKNRRGLKAMFGNRWEDFLEMGVE